MKTLPKKQDKKRSAASPLPPISGTAPVARRGRPPGKGSAERWGVQSIDVGMQILDVLTRASGPLPLKVISDVVGMAPSNVHRYLVSFIRAGMLRQDAQTARYDLGPLAVRVGLAGLARLDVLQLARPELERLSEQFSLMGVISVYGNRGPTVVHVQQCNPPVLSPITLGAVIPLLRSASGRVFLGFLPEATTQPVVHSELTINAQYGLSNYQLSSETPRTIEDVKRLRAQIRKQGHASTDMDMTPGLTVAACPVLNMQGEATVVLSLIGPDPQLVNGSSPVVSELKTVCARLSRESGYLAAAS